MVGEVAQQPSRHPLLTTRSRRVREARRLLRRRERAALGLFLADGPKAVQAALSAEGRVREVFATPAAASEYAGLLRGTAVTLVEERALRAISDSVSPAGIVATCALVDRALDDVVRSAGDSLVICTDVRDPGNAGTIIRTADASGAGGVVLAGDSVDAHNPKTVRASVGSLFHVPVAVERDPAVALAAARAGGYAVLAADPAGELDLFAAADVLAGPVAWVFGNEARGLPDDLVATADHRIAIPIRGRAESLNLATAAAVCLYETARVRGH